MGRSHRRRRRANLRFGDHRVVERSTRRIPAVVIGTRDRVRPEAHLRGLLKSWPVGVIERSGIVNVGVELGARSESMGGPPEFSRETRVHGERMSVVHADDAKPGGYGEVAGALGEADVIAQRRRGCHRVRRSEVGIDNDTRQREHRCEKHFHRRIGHV